MQFLLLWLLLWIPDSTTPFDKLSPSKNTSLSPKESTSVTNKIRFSTTQTPMRSVSSNAGSGKTTKKEATEELSIWVMLLIIVSCGLLGGTWNYLRTCDTVTAATSAGTNPSPRLKRHWQTCLLGGIIAGGIVPFLLISTSSKLLEEPSTYHYFVFGAYCLAAAVSSATFIEAAASSLIKRLQADLKQTKQALATTTAQALNLQTNLLNTNHILATTTNQSLQLQADLNQTQNELVATKALTIKLQDKANKLESIAMTLHGIQQLSNPVGVINPEQQQRFNQQMQVLSDQLDAVKTNAP